MIASLNRPTGHRRGAFTLLEVLVVVAILVILASVGTISVIKYLEDARIDKATMDAQTLYKACKSYYVKTGSWPQGPQELIQPEGGGTYLENGINATLDPWGKQFQFVPRVNPNSGDEEIQIITQSDKGVLIQWPKQ